MREEKNEKEAGGEELSVWLNPSARAAGGALGAVLACALAIVLASRGGSVLPAPPGAPEPARLGADDSALDLGPRIYWLEDREGLDAGAALARFRSGGFQPPRWSVPNFGYVKHPFWFAVDVEVGGEAPRDLLVDIAYPLLDRVESWQADAGSGGFGGGPPTDGRLAGDALPFREREVGVKNLVFRRSLEPGRTTLLFRARTGGSMSFPASLLTPAEHAARTASDYAVQGAYIGVILVMVLLNLLIFAESRDRARILYAAYVLSYLVVSMSMNGLTFQVLWPGSPVWASRALPILLFLETFLIVLFAGEFLGIARFPRLRLAFLALGGLPILGMAASVFADYASVIRASAAYGVGTVFAVLVAGLYAAAGGLRSARYYVAGWAVLLIGIILYGLQNMGFLPWTFATRNLQLIGSVLEVAFVSLAIAEKGAEAERESAEAHKELLEERTRALEEQTKLTAEAESRLRITEIYTRHSIVELIRKGFDPTSFPPRDREFAVLFADIREFTSLAELRQPLEVVGLLNSYFEAMNERIMAEGGEVDKLMGDCVMALFPDPDAAVRASVAMRGALDSLNDRQGFHGRRRLDNGVGLNWGRVIVGNIGSTGKMDYTVVGDVVNAASRLEQLTKFYGCAVIVSAELKEALSGSYRSRFLDLVHGKGKREPTEIHEIYEHEPERIVEVKEALAPRMAEAYDLYRRGEFAEAARLYGAIVRSAGPHSWLPGRCLDPAADCLRERCEALDAKRRLGLLPCWNGVFEFQSK